MDKNLTKITLREGSGSVEVNEKIAVLGEIVNSLISAVSRLQSVKEVETNAFFKNIELSFPKDGIDFHKTKKLYEINLVKQALRHTSGHQSSAAKLLRMRNTTLNSIIKKHNISV